MGTWLNTVWKFQKFTHTQFFYQKFSEIDFEGNSL